MSAIFRREFKSFFTGPIGYIALAVMIAASGMFFLMYNLNYGMADLTGVFSGLFTISLLVIPFLTMRLFSDEKRQKTDQALLTAPGSLTGIVLGKFFAALLLFTLSIAVTLVYAIILAFKVSPDWMLLIGNFIGLLLVGGLIISIGVFISCLTESQVIAALGTLAVSVVLLTIDQIAALLSGITVLEEIVGFLSVTTRYSEFTAGLINYDCIVYFITMQALFIFLTVRVLDSRRWN